jgi:adenosylcobinamide-GDP ribazoletransferase
VALTSLAGAVGFLSRIPIGQDGTAWEAFRSTPTTFPVVGYALGALVALLLLVPAPSPTSALLFVTGIYAVTGVNHADGLIDLGDAIVVHGDPEVRREVMRDTVVGVGGTLAATLVVLGLVTAGFTLAGLPSRSLLLVVTAEVGAKAGTALLVCGGSAPHEGLGSALTTRASARSMLPVAIAAAPAALLTWPRFLPGVASLLAAIITSGLILYWARANLGGVSGDVLGATNELARVAALHAGVVAWTRF